MHIPQPPLSMFSEYYAHIVWPVRPPTRHQTCKRTIWEEGGILLHRLWSTSYVAWLAGYKGKPSRGMPNDAELPNELNAFYARFKEYNTVPCMKAPVFSDVCVISLSVVDVSKTFKQVNNHKATWPEGIPECILKACTDQLASVFTDIFNLSLSQTVIPTCFKLATLVPVPKSSKVTCLNDYHPVALRSVIMKCFGRLFMTHITIPDSLNPLQFAPTDPQMMQS